MYEHILLPTDGSETSTAAARHALDIAEKYNATVHALFVVDTTTGWLTVSKNEVRDAVRDLGRETGTRALAAVERLASQADVECRTALLDGAPDEQILRYVEDHEIDLVVLGTHGRSGIEKRLLGSVSDRVIRSCAVPVMTVQTRAEEGNEATGTRPPTHE